MCCARSGNTPGPTRRRSPRLCCSYSTSTQWGCGGGGSHPGDGPRSSGLTLQQRTPVTGECGSKFLISVSVFRKGLTQEPKRSLGTGQGDFPATGSPGCQVTNAQRHTSYAGSSVTVNEKLLPWRCSALHCSAELGRVCPSVCESMAGRAGRATGHRRMLSALKGTASHSPWRWEKKSPHVL